MYGLKWHDIHSKFYDNSSISSVDGSEEKKNKTQEHYELITDHKNTFNFSYLC
jgi:hypothetical protein